MKTRYTLLVLAFLSISAVYCKIDKDYDLRSNNINYEINAGQQVEVPIGNFSTIKIKDLLSKSAEEYFVFEDEEKCSFDPDGQELTDFDFGLIKISGLSFINLEKTHIPNIRFYMDIKNTLPFEFDVKCHIIDTHGEPVAGVTPIIDAHISPGSDENPVSSPAILNILSSKELRGISFDGIRFNLTVREMPYSKVTMKRGCGIAIKSVRLQLPDGINFKVKKKKSNQD